MAEQEPQLQLFEKQKKIYPKRVWGKYRELKWWAMIITLGIYYLAPFIRWDRGPNAPDQAILIDLEARRAYWFFIEIWPQEVYYLTGILILAAIALFFATSVLGRVWCGYFCPQTVWTDLFVWVERIVQGDRNARMKLDKSSLSMEKVWKKSLTHFIWLIISLLTAGAFVFYFNDAPDLWNDILNASVSNTVLIFVASLTFSTYLMAGYAREQVCTYMCPYARFQSAMFDNDTLLIGYNEDRGETRGKYKKGSSWEGRGHCIDCTKCVQVCPVGIDIRDGLQMECIACGLCADACDEVMEKVGLPPKLIGYYSSRSLHEGPKAQVHFVRPRTIYYSLIITFVTAIMLYNLITRAPLELHVLHDRNPLFVKLSDGHIRNGYDIKILNKTYEHKTYTINVNGLNGAEIDVRGVKGLTSENLKAQPDSVASYKIFVKAPQQDHHNREVHFILRDNDTGFTDKYENLFISPHSSR